MATTYSFYGMNPDGSESEAHRKERLNAPDFSALVCPPCCDCWCHHDALYPEAAARGEAG